MNLRKHVQENESLEFRNQQLSKRVALLQEDINSPARSRKKKGGADSSVNEIHAQELASKISENERLHMKVLELTQKSERTIKNLEMKIANLEKEVATHHAGVDELNKEHRKEVETLSTDKAVLEGQLAKEVSEVEELRKALEELQTRVGREGYSAEPAESSGKDQKSQIKSLLMSDDDGSFVSLNVPVVDTKLQAEVLTILRSGMELVSTFTTQMSTFHSYLEQRCKAYPIDTSTGSRMSFVNQKLCELLHNSASFTRPLVSALTSYCDRLESNPFSQATAGDLHEFSSSHQKFVIFLETLTPYLQLSLQEESAESVCGAQLTDVNQRISQIFPLLTGTFASINECVSIIVEGPASGVPNANAAACLLMIQSKLTDIKSIVDDLSDQYSSKIGYEYHLPTTSQKLNTTNECVVSVLGGISSTAHQLCGFLESNSEVLSASLDQSSPNSTENEHQSSRQSVLNQLRTRATTFMHRLNQLDNPSTVPYTLAVYNAHSLSSSSESKQTLMKQVMANQEKLSKLEQGKEQLVLDLQLLKVKYEKEQKRVVTLESELARSSATDTGSETHGHISSKPVLQQPAVISSTLSGSVGSLSTASTEEEPIDDSVMIRKHFVGRIADLNRQVQDSDSKSSHYYAECRALHKQLNHNSVLRVKLAQELQVASDTIQQLQDQLTTTSSNYEKQLSTMSDHLCELNDRLMKQNDEIEDLKRPTKGRRRGK